MGRPRHVASTSRSEPSIRVDHSLHPPGSARYRRAVNRVSDSARVLLAGIRLVNGSVTLAAPGAFARRAGVDAATSASALYALRLFGVRTVLIGLDLLQRDPQGRARALRVAPLIHLSDLAAAAVAGKQGQLPARAARVAVVVSGANVVLSLLARRGTGSRRRRS